MWWLINTNFLPQSSAVSKTKSFVKIFSHKSFSDMKTQVSKTDLSLKKVIGHSRIIILTNLVIHKYK